MIPAAYSVCREPSPTSGDYKVCGRANMQELLLKSNDGKTGLAPGGAAWCRWNIASNRFGPTQHNWEGW